MRQNILIFIFLPFFLSSCVYFNTFHNTKKYYNEARKERQKRPEVDKATSQELRKYDETIEKASKILELYSDSKYVDDALFILGECFYYKQNYVKAQRKFVELSQYFPDSEYYPKARLWLARTNIELKDYSSAKLILTTLLDTQKLNKNIKYEALYQLGEIEFLQEFYTQAKDILLKAADETSNKETRARSLYRLGECRLQLEEYDKAVDDFYNAMRNSPDQRFKFDATLNYARSLKLSGRYDEAKDVCAALLSNELYKKLHGWAQLEMADCIYLETKQRYAQASRGEFYNEMLDVLEEFKIVTLENKRTEVAAHAFFQMGTIYETDLSEFANAKDNYSKVKAEYGRCELVPDAVKKTKDIDDLIRLSNLVKKAQGEQLLAEGKGGYNLSSLELLLLEHGNGPELRFMKFQRENGVTALDSTELEERNKQQEDELVKNKLQLAETYMFQFNQIDSALFEYDEIIELFPEHADVVNALYSTAYIYESEFQNDAKSDSLLSVIIERYPDSEQAQDARVKLGLSKKRTRDEIASELFAGAEKKLFDGMQVQYAMADYQRIVEEYPETQYAPKALYALGWIQEEMVGDIEGARQVYQDIVNSYPDSEYSKECTIKLDAYDQAVKAEIAKAEAEAKAKADSLQALLAANINLDTTMAVVDSLAGNGQTAIPAGDSLAANAPAQVLVADSLTGNGQSEILPGDTLAVNEQAVQVAVTDSTAGNGHTKQTTVDSAAAKTGADTVIQEEATKKAQKQTVDENTKAVPEEKRQVAKQAKPQEK